jgi:hypothetical protein
LGVRRFNWGSTAVRRTVAILGHARRRGERQFPQTSAR